MLTGIVIYVVVTIALCVWLCRVDQGSSFFNEVKPYCPELAWFQ